MNKTYRILNSITLNVTAEKYNAIASPILKSEAIKHKEHFGFDFIRLYEEYIIYKITLENEPNNIQGMFAFKPSTGFLQCINMETNEMNKHGKAIYGGIGKLIVALCCKISFDNNFGGFIVFEAKNSLFGYYGRFGALRIGNSNKMFIDESAAQKLIERYF